MMLFERLIVNVVESDSLKIGGDYQRIRKRNKVHRDETKIAT